MNKCTNPKVGELIMQYELGALSDEACLRFDEHLMECDYCLSELKNMSPVIEAMRDSGEKIAEGLHRQGISLASIEKTPVKKRVQSKGIVERFKNLLQDLFQRFDALLRPRVLVPATLVAGAMVLFVMLSPVFRSGNPYLYHLSFDKLPYEAGDLRETTSDAHVFFNQGMANYKNDNFEDAITDLKKAVELTPDEGEWLQYLGVCYYLDRQAQPAIETLTKADSLTAFFQKLRIRWYLSQALLLNDEADRAIPYLEWIVAQNKEYVSQAETLLAAIESEKWSMNE